MTQKKPMYLIAALTDKPNSWEFTNIKKSKAMQFSIALHKKKLTKNDIKFIEANMKRFDDPIEDIEVPVSLNQKPDEPESETVDPNA